jgi:hypothetical protein
MKKGRSDSAMLAVVLTLFGASVGFLQWRIAARVTEQAAVKRTVRYPYVSDLKIASELQPLLYTHSIGSIVGTFKKFDADTMCSTAHAVVFDNDCPLSNDERLSLLLALATSVSYNRNLQDRVFAILAEYDRKHGIEPLLLTTTRSEYAAITVDLIAWAQRKKTDLARNWMQDAFKFAIDQGDAQVLESLYMRGVRLTPEQASECLWYIVRNDKKPDLIPFFAKWGKADMNYVSSSGRSLIAEAIAHQNQEMARMLLAEGARMPLRFVRPELAHLGRLPSPFKGLS